MHTSEEAFDGNLGTGDEALCKMGTYGIAFLQQEETNRTARMEVRFPRTR